MNRHDQARKDAIIKTLCKVKEQAGTALVYLNVNDRDPENIFIVNDVLEHIEIALERLGAEVPEEHRTKQNSFSDEDRAYYKELAQEAGII